MKKSSLLGKVCAGVLTAAGLVLTLLTRAAAIADGAAQSDKLIFALSLILFVVGAVLLATAFMPARGSTNVRKLTMVAMFAALCYVGFAVFKIDIPSEKTAFHLGNVFVVLGALYMGGLWGGLAGAVGLTIADLTSGYVTSAPKTFVMKLGIGLVVGAIAHGVFRISRSKDERRAALPVATVVSASAGMLFNVVADPIIGYFYKIYVLGVPQDAANIWVKIGALTTLVNAVIAVLAATVLYLATRPALEKTRLLPHI